MFRSTLTSQRLRPSPCHGRVGSHVECFEACSAFTYVAACLLAESPKATLSIEGFDGFVTSTAAPIATGWSDSCRVGVAPTENARLFTAHHGAILPPAGFTGPARSRALARRPQARHAGGMAKPIAKLVKLLTPLRSMNSRRA